VDTIYESEDGYIYRKYKGMFIKYGKLRWKGLCFSLSLCMAGLTFFYSSLFYDQGLIKSDRPITLVFLFSSFFPFYMVSIKKVFVKEKKVPLRILKFSTLIFNVYRALLYLGVIIVLIKFVVIPVFGQYLN